VIRIQVIGIWRVSCVQGISVFESVSWKVGWKVSCIQGIYVFESVNCKQTLQVGMGMQVLLAVRVTLSLNTDFGQFSIFPTNG
jgi:hypothetical protein